MLHGRKLGMTEAFVHIEFPKLTHICAEWPVLQSCSRPWENTWKV